MKRLDVVYHAALHFIANACGSSLNQRRKSHILVYTLKALLGLLPNYITSLLCLRRKNYSTRSSSGIKLEVPRIHSEHGKSAFSYYASWLWNEFQAIIPLETILSLTTFKIAV